MLILDLLTLGGKRVPGRVGICIAISSADSIFTAYFVVIKLCNDPWENVFGSKFIFCEMKISVEMFLIHLWAL